MASHFFRPFIPAGLHPIIPASLKQKEISEFSIEDYIRMISKTAATELQQSNGQNESD